MAAAATTRFEFRLPVETKRMIERAAALLGVNASDFARSVLEEHVARVLRDHLVVTPVPPDFFDSLLQALDAPAAPNAALAAAAGRADELVEWQ